MAGLQAGADDYLVKPFAIAELTARLRGAAAPPRRGRRRGRTWRATSSSTRAATSRRARGRELELTRREFELLDVFVRHPGQVLSRDQLLSLVLGLHDRRRDERRRRLRRLPAAQARGARASRGSSTPCAASAGRCGREGAAQPARADRARRGRRGRAGGVLAGALLLARGRARRRATSSTASCASALGAILGAGRRAATAYGAPAAGGSEPLLEGQRHVRAGRLRRRRCVEQARRRARTTRPTSRRTTASRRSRSAARRGARSTLHDRRPAGSPRLAGAELARAASRSASGAIRRLVLLLGFSALALTALAAWGFTDARAAPARAPARGRRPRQRRREDLSTPLPDDDGPEEVRPLAGALNEMLERLGASTAADRARARGDAPLRRRRRPRAAHAADRDAREPRHARAQPRALGAASATRWWPT